FDADDVAGSSIPPQTFFGKTGKQGEFSISINPGFRPPGTYRIAATQDLPSGHVEGSTTFIVPCRTLAPTLAVDPTCEPAAAGQPGAYTLALSGTGFATGFVGLTFDPSGTPITGSVQADGTGAFTTQLLVDGQAPNAYVIVASQTTSV